MDPDSVLPLVHALGYQQLLVFAERRGSDEERYEKLLAMRPEPDDYPRAFGPALVERARALYGELWQRPPPLSPKPGPTELWLRSALSEDFAAWNERGSEFPGGYRKLGPDLVPGVVWLAFKFVAPGDFSGLSFDGLAWVNQRLVWFPQPWRLVPIGPG